MFFEDARKKKSAMAKKRDDGPTARSRKSNWWSGSITATPEAKSSRNMR